MSTDRSRMSIPGDIGPGKDRSGDARPHVVVRATMVAQRNHAAVATAQTAAHHPLDRHLRGPAVPDSKRRDGLQHGFWTARIDRDIAVSTPQLAVERYGHPAPIAEAAVFGREYGPDMVRGKPVEMKKLARRSSAVEQRGRRAACAERLGERDKRSEAHTAGNHPGLGWRIDGQERTAQRAEARDR